jgi:hypothetical protein
MFISFNLVTLVYWRPENKQNQYVAVNRAVSDLSHDETMRLPQSVAASEAGFK